MPGNRLWFVAGTAAALLGAALPAHAQQDWYRIELLVFTNPQRASEETWEPLPALTYPERTRFLVDPQRFARVRQDYAGAIELDEFGRTIVTSGPRARSTSAPSTATAAPAIASAVDAEPTAGSAQPVAPATIASLPRPYVRLPETSLEFRDKLSYMQNQGGYRILLHTAWAQPVTSESRSIPVVIDDSGDTHSWPELQGSVNLYLARFVYLNTNLWLNTRGDYLAGAWQMPAPPQGPPSLIVEESMGAQDFDEIGADGPATTGEPDAQSAIVQSGSAAQPASYPFRHAVLLQQTRRMRGQEVHYLDHPLFGVVAKLTPLTPEDLAGLAQAEAGAGLPPL